METAERKVYQADNYLYLVQWVLNEYYGGGHNMARKLGIDVADLFQIGCLGLVRASQQFDPTNEKGAKFMTYAIMKIRSELTHAIRDDNYALKFPIKIRELAPKVSRIDDATPKKIQEELGVPYKIAFDAYFYLNRRMISLYSTPFKIGEDNMVLMDEIPAEQSAEDTALRCMELEERLSILTEKQRNVCSLSLKGHTQKEIAQKIGLPLSTVSSMQRKSLKQIQSTYQ